MDNNQAAGTSFPVASMLTIVFVVLKLTGVIAWSWWWVLSPLWIYLGIFLLAVALVVIYSLIARNN